MGEIALVLRAGEKICADAADIQHKQTGKHNPCRKKIWHCLLRFFARPEDRVKRRKQRQRHQKRDTHVQRRVDAQIHPRKRHQQQKRDARPPHPALFRLQRNGAEGSDGVLRVPGWERIPRRRGARRLHNRKLRVQHPRARNPAGDFQELVCQRPEKPHHKYIVARSLVHAPEQQQRQRQKRQLVSKIRNAGEQRVERGHADGLQQS